MSKISDMAATIEELRAAAAAINDAADWLAQQFSGDSEPVKEAPAPEPLPTLEEVRAVLADASRKATPLRYALCSRSTAARNCPRLTRPTTRPCLLMWRD